MSHHLLESEVVAAEGRTNIRAAGALSLSYVA